MIHQIILSVDGPLSALHSCPVGHACGNGVARCAHGYKYDVVNQYVVDESKYPPQ
jgi:hypothetical protein